jgi:plasmid maintenance system antidote protein VapI
MSVSNKVKLRIIELRAEGLSYAKIAEALKISKQTALEIVRDNKDEVTSLQAMEMEALFDAEKINLRGRVEQLSSLQARLREELAKRDLSKIPTDKLIALFIKTNQALKDEVFTPEVKSVAEIQQERNDQQLKDAGWGW